MNIAKWFTDAEWHTAVEGTDDFGQTTYTWTKHKDIQGRMRQLNASERNTSETTGTVSTHRFYTKEFGIGNTDKIKFDNKFYQVIRSNNVMNFSEFAQLDCELTE